MGDVAPAVIERIFREQRAAVIAALVRRLRDIEKAEDALQSAWVRAVETWRERGVPESPGAWLFTAALRIAIDDLRRRSLHVRATTDLARRSRADDGDPDAEAFTDDRLRLIFTCCHPALAEDAQVALTLQTIGGLTAREIARAFLVPEATMAQRLVRVKRKIRDAAIPYEVPDPERLHERLDGVLTVVYLIFNEGHQVTEGAALNRPDLCEEAVRLARVLVSLLPEEPECSGLLALLLLTLARQPARTSATGSLVPLELQDRTLWNATLAAEGAATLDHAISLRRPGRFQIQAAIAALHTQASTWESTDWRQIEALYAALLRHDPSPVVELNRAVAVSMTEGPAAGLALLARLQALSALDGYQPFHAARADLLVRAGRSAESRSAYDRAIYLTRNPAEREFLRSRRPV